MQNLASLVCKKHCFASKVCYLLSVKNLLALKSSKGISHIMIEEKPKVLETCTVCMIEVDSETGCAVTPHRPMTETEQVSEMTVFRSTLMLPIAQEHF
jgi:predicted molibdopterin-dependent oxidoreductase YjgC